MYLPLKFPSSILIKILKEFRCQLIFWRILMTYSPLKLINFPYRQKQVTSQFFKNDLQVEFWSKCLKISWCICHSSFPLVFWSKFLKNSTVIGVFEDSDDLLLTFPMGKKYFSDLNSDQKIIGSISKQNSDRNASRIPKSSDLFATKDSHQYFDQNYWRVPKEFRSQLQLHF